MTTVKTPTNGTPESAKERAQYPESRNDERSHEENAQQCPSEVAL
jgi:hypothetical protein